MLVVTKNDNPIDIENRKGDLTIFLNGNSKLRRIIFNNMGTDDTGSLTITTYENIPSSLTLETDDGESVIKGFNSLTIDEKKSIFLIDPENGSYWGRQLVTEHHNVAIKATIGQYLKPLVNGQTIDFPKEKFETAKLTNTVIDDVHYNLVQHDEDTDEDDDYYDSATGAIVINNTANDPQSIIEEVEKGMLVPASPKYANEGKGYITFIVPNGRGKIKFKVQTEIGFTLKLKVGKGVSKKITKLEKGDVEFDYNTDDPTVCTLHLEKDDGTSGTRNGMREKSHGKVFSLKVSPAKILSTNPLGGVSGFPDSETPEVDTYGEDEPTGINEIKVETDNTLESNNDNWYDLQGRRIDKPTKAGIYIQNRKKIVIR